MSKTSQENKLKKLSETKSASGGKKLAVEDLNVVEDRKATEETSAEEVSTVTKKTKVRGKKYLAAKKKIDVNKYYSPKEAVEIAKASSFSKFEGKIEAHITVLEAGNLGEINFPYLETGSKKIVVLNDTILAELKEGKINFDLLIATPVTMPKLLPLARLLGPKGLMPNPKNGTLTDKPEEAVKKLSVAKTVVKTEKKAPVAHLVVGKVSQPVEEIVANIKELIKVIQPPKIKKFVICPTMGPSVKIEISK